MNINKLILGCTGALSAILLLASGQAVAQQSASAQAMLEEIIVTARRREESLSDLPLSGKGKCTSSIERRSSAAATEGAPAR